VGRERGSDERHHRAGVARSAWFDAEDHVMADIGYDARRLNKGRLPDLKRVENPRARRTRGVRLEQRLIVRTHDDNLDDADAATRRLTVTHVD
jgi:hypothetical protein